MHINYTWLDYPSPDDAAVILYLSGCAHKCLGCHNSLMQQPGPPLPEPDSIYRDLYSAAYRYRTKKLVISGGDPLYGRNTEVVREILCLNRYFDICIYTGYTMDVVKSLDLTGFKFLKCGKYEVAQAQVSSKSDEKICFASRNQKLYDSNYNLISDDGIYKF